MASDNGFSGEALPGGLLMWDMAGTLVFVDPLTAKPVALPGCDVYLPELARDFRHVVTTGDSAVEARHQLGAHEILPHVVRIFADLHEPVGKPYGRVMAEMGAGSERSLAVGDRLRTDVGADTDRIVSILVNQEARPVNAGMIAYMVHILRRQSAGDFLTAFNHLTITAMPEPADQGPQAGGEVVAAWRRDDGFPYRLWLWTHPGLEGRRAVIVLF
ncbi:MAG: HAD family hydrolase [bacterium]|nr:HAD family hydrolase [bacterium]